MVTVGYGGGRKLVTSGMVFYLLFTFLLSECVGGVGAGDVVIVVRCF